MLKCKYKILTQELRPNINLKNAEFYLKKSINVQNNIAFINHFGCNKTQLSIFFFMQN
jgi:hypothetical protein